MSTVIFLILLANSAEIISVFKKNAFIKTLKIYTALIPNV